MTDSKSYNIDSKPLETEKVKIEAEKLFKLILTTAKSGSFTLYIENGKLVNSNCLVKYKKES